MDNHPIPQDVTGFQFKLIGNMTVKQFAYLATGVVLAGILFELPVNILIKFPFCAFFAILGISLAYLPIGGRPMDLMIGNYIKALFRPTQFVYEKIGGQIYFPNKMRFAAIKNVRQYKNDFNPLPKDKLKVYLESLNNQPKNKVDEIENNFLMSVSDLATGNTSYQSALIAQTPSRPHIDPSGEQKTVAPQPVAIAQPISPKPQQNESIRPTIPLVKPLSKATGMPSVPDSPNLITGVAKDPRGNALPNILVEVKDKDGNPVRAFRTNEVGRFASATPLANGTYTIELDDPGAQNKFEKTTINVTGQIILPIEIVSIDTREELRRSLFSTGTPVSGETQVN